MLDELELAALEPCCQEIAARDRVLRRVAKNLYLRVSRHGSFSLSINLCCDRFVEIVLATVLAHVGGHIPHDYHRLTPL